MRSSEAAERAYLTLERIASALGIPVRAFLEPQTGPQDLGEQERECLCLFRQIQDPIIRLGCLDIMRTAATGTEVR